jgi:hypothetical protein
VHYHRHEDHQACTDDHEWPEWAHALLVTFYILGDKLMSQQDQINADVALLADALEGIGKELQDFKASLAAQAPELDLTGLDAIAQKALTLKPPSQASDAPAAPAEAPAAPVDAAPAADPEVPQVTQPDVSSVPVEAPVPAPEAPVADTTAATPDDGTNPAPTL